MTASLLHNLTTSEFSAQSLMLQERFGEAVPLWKECVRLSAIIYGAEHRCTIVCLEKLAVCLTRAGFHQEALGYFRQTYESIRARFDENHQTFCISSKHLALCLVANGEEQEALPQLEEAIGAFTNLRGPAFGTTLHLQSVLIDCLRRGGKDEEIIAVGEQVLHSVRPSGLNKDKFLFHILRHTARAYHKLGKEDQGLAFSIQAADLGLLVYGPRHTKVLDDLRLSSRCLWRLGRRNEAIAVLEKVLETVKLYRKGDKYYLDLEAELGGRRYTMAKMERRQSQQTGTTDNARLDL